MHTKCDERTGVKQYAPPTNSRGHNNNRCTVDLVVSILWFRSCRLRKARDRRWWEVIPVST